MKSGIEYLTGKTKRSLDVLGGIAIATATMPAATAVGLASCIDTGSINPLFKQERVGRYDLPFMTLKFRTIAKTAMTEATYGTFDPRASKLAQVLRQSGLDEIPQIYNVVMGSMSLVGARPMLDKDIEFMELSAPRIFDEWYAYYQEARPGMAGPSQVYRHHFKNGASRKIYRQSAELDLAYFDKASIAKDLVILTAVPFQMLQANLNVIEDPQAPRL